MRQWIPQGCLLCNSLLRYAILPLGQRQHYYPAHTSYLLLSTDITICETQGELAVFHTYPPPSLIISHYTNVKPLPSTPPTCGHMWPSSKSCNSLIVPTFSLHCASFALSFLIPLIIFTCTRQHFIYQWSAQSVEKDYNAGCLMLKVK